MATFNQIIGQFDITTVMIVICVVIHGIGLFSLNNAARNGTNLPSRRFVC